MANTQRTMTDLLTNLFQDGQADGEIDPQDFRDIIASMEQSHGGLYVSSSAATTIAGAGTFVKAAGASTLFSATAKKVSMPADNRLRYDGAPTKNFMVICNASIQAASTSPIDIALRLAENGSTLAETEVRAQAETAVKDYQLTTVGHFELATNDYIEPFVANITDTDNVTVTYLTMMAIGLMI